MSTTQPHAVVLYCKSYRRDVLRVKRLLGSVERYNRDALPVYVSMPREDRALFEQQLGPGRCTLIDDEDIVAANKRVQPDKVQAIPGRVSQAIVKAEFWRLGLCRNYVCIDADSEFIADFHAPDFIAPDGDCYTVIHQNKDLLQMASNRGVGKVSGEFKGEVARFAAIFGRRGPAYSFAPSPFLWSAKVWKSLDERYLRPRQWTLWDAVTHELPESLWYGEAMLAYQAIPMRPIEPLFRVYHYNWQYYALKRLGETRAAVADNYLGVIHQSNWEFEMDYGVESKPLTSRLLRRLKRGLRYLQNRWLM